MLKLNAKPARALKETCESGVGVAEHVALAAAGDDQPGFEARVDLSRGMLLPRH